MAMTTRVRRLVLTAHVTTSVGWLGAIVAFLPLAVAGVISRDAQTVRGAYLATILLLSYMQTLRFMAGVAAETTGSGAVPAVLRSFTAVLHASLALLALLVATTLAVYKPQGMTRYWQRRLREQRSRPPAAEVPGSDSNAGTGDGFGEVAEVGSISKTPRWVKVFGIIALVLTLLLALGLIVGGLGGHGRGRILRLLAEAERDRAG